LVSSTVVGAHTYRVLNVRGLPGAPVRLAARKFSAPRMRAGLTGRLMAATSALAIVIAVAFVFLILAMRDGTRIRGIAEHNQGEIKLAREVRNHLIDLETSQRGFVITGDERFLESWEAARRALPESLAALRAIAEGPGQAGRAEKLQRDATSYLNDYALPLVDAARRGDPSVRGMVDEEGRRWMAGLRQQVDTYNTEEMSQNITARAHVDRVYRQAAVLAGGGLAVSLLATAIMTGYLSRGVVAPVRRTAGMAERLAAGDLTARLTATGTAEIGVLERSFNSMAEALQRGREEQEALRRVAMLVARGKPSSEVFSAVSREVGLMLEIEITRLLRFECDGSATVVAAWQRTGDPLPMGSRIAIETTVAARVRETGEPARLTEQSPAELPRGSYRAVGTPINVGGMLWGAMTALSPEDRPLPEGTEARMAEFTELVGTAIANAQARTDLSASRARIVTAADEARRRIQRNLHDGIQQRLVALALRLRMFQETSPPEAPEARRELDALATTLAETMEEVRDVARGIHPAILSGGLMPALRALASRSELPIELELHVQEILPQAVAVAAYYVVAEALSNASKHARASVVRLHSDVREKWLFLIISDDGVGGADSSRGSGLIGLADRVEALGGKLIVDSPAGVGTSLRVELPLAGPGQP
jgi:signal transduction histidine kinase